MIVHISASFFGNTLWMTWLMKSVTGTDRNTLALCRLSLADCVFWVTCNKKTSLRLAWLGVKYSPP